MQASTLRIAWRNLGRNKRRTLLAVGAIALGQLTLVFTNALMAGSFSQMLDAITGPLVGHVQIHNAEWREERAIDLYIDHLSDVTAALAKLPEVREIRPRIYAPALSASGEESDAPADAEPAMVVGLNVAAEAEGNGILGDLRPDELPSGHNVVVGKVLANRLGVERGQDLALIGQDVDGFPTSDLFHIQAVVDSSVEIVKTMGVLMPLEEAGAFLAMPDQAHEIVVHGEDYKQAEALAAKIAGLDVVAGAEVLAWREAVPMLVKIIDMKGWFDFILLAIVFAAAAAGIANTALMSAFERTREFGMLLAVGSRPGRIVGMVIIEAVLVGFVGVAIGSVMGTAIVLITGHTGIDYAALGGTSAEDFAYGGINFSYIIYPVFEMRHIVLGLCAVTLTSILASLWPASHAARLEPVEAMRK